MKQKCEIVHSIKKNFDIVNDLNTWNVNSEDFFIGYYTHISTLADVQESVQVNWMFAWIDLGWTQVDFKLNTSGF